jgi:hypothetical protein
MLRRRHPLALLLAAGCSGLAAAVAWAGAPLNATPPVVTGDPVPGSTLTCDPGTWEDVIDGSTPLVAWVVDGVQTTGFAVSEELPLTLTEADLGKRIACRAEASNIEGTSTAVSAEVVVIRCTAETQADLQAALQDAESLHATTAERLVSARTAYKKLVAAQAKQKRNYFAKVKDGKRRRAFLARQQAARANAKQRVTTAARALDLVQQALDNTSQKLAACALS